MGIRDELVDTIKEFIATNGHEPNAIFLTIEDEERLASMTRDEAGGDTTGNVREDWPTLCGAEVVWEADVRHCE